MEGFKTDKRSELRGGWSRLDDARPIQPLTTWLAEMHV